MTWHTKFRTVPGVEGYGFPLQVKGGLYTYLSSQPRQQNALAVREGGRLTVILGEETVVPTTLADRIAAVAEG